MSRVPREGEVVLMSHPVMMNRYVLGKLAADPTKKTCMVVYFGRNGFEGQEPRRRNIDTIKAILHPEADVASIAEAIQKTERQRDEEVKAVMAKAEARVFTLVGPAPDDA